MMLVSYLSVVLMPTLAKVLIKTFLFAVNDYATFSLIKLSTFFNSFIAAQLHIVGGLT